MRLAGILMIIAGAIFILLSAAVFIRTGGRSAISNLLGPGRVKTEKRDTDEFTLNVYYKRGKESPPERKRRNEKTETLLLDSGKTEILSENGKSGDTEILNFRESERKAGDTEFLT